jgi:hypothetical protein
MVSHVVGILLSSLLLSLPVPAHLVADPVAVTVMPHDMELLLAILGGPQAASEEQWSAGRNSLSSTAAVGYRRNY